MTTVRVATTSNVPLTTGFENGDTIDGIILATFNLVLIKDQTTAIENGVYRVNPSGTPTRVLNFRVGVGISDKVVYVTEGDDNGFTEWTCTNLVPNDIIGTDNIVFTQTGITTPVSTIAIQTITNKTITNPSNLVRATELATTGASVVISGAAPPVAGDVFTATSPTTCGWNPGAKILSAASFIRSTNITGVSTSGQTELTWSSIDASVGTSITLVSSRINLVDIGTYLVTVDIGLDQTGGLVLGNFRGRLYLDTTGTGTPIHTIYTFSTAIGVLTSTNMTKLITTTVPNQPVSIWGISLGGIGTTYSVLSSGFKGTVQRLA